MLLTTPNQIFLGITISFANLVLGNTSAMAATFIYNLDFGGNNLRTSSININSQQPNGPILEAKSFKNITENILGVLHSRNNKGLGVLDNPRNNRLGRSNQNIEGISFSLKNEKAQLLSVTFDALPNNLNARDFTILVDDGINQFSENTGLSNNVGEAIVNITTSELIGSSFLFTATDNNDRYRIKSLTFSTIPELVNTNISPSSTSIPEPSNILSLSLILTLGGSIKVLKKYQENKKLSR